MILKNKNISGESLGFVETKSLAGLIEASDAMVKAANVRLINSYKIGSALVTVVVKGDLASCIAAVEAGKKAAMKIGELVSAHVIARPCDDTNHMVNDLISENKSNTKRDKELSTEDEAKQEIVMQTESIETMIVESLMSSNGLNITEIVRETKTDISEVIKVLKKLIDDSQIEKVGLKYFIK